MADEIEKMMRGPSERPLIDDVKDIHAVLRNRPEYQKYCVAIFDDESVAGTLFADAIMASGMIRNYALERNILNVAVRTIPDIVKELGGDRSRMLDESKEP